MGEREGIEREREKKGLYDGSGNRIGGVRKLISILTRLSEEVGFFLRKGRLIFSPSFSWFVAL